jgi:phospholipid/cholesterol/gamma-HCH transport system ATP-binding protein
MIRVENIKRQFGEQQVLKGINTVFEPGKTNLIIGRSGAGKTVLLKILVGLVQPTSGTVWYGDVNFTKLNVKQRKAIRSEMGMLFQGSALFDSMTVEENVRFPLDMFTSLSSKDKKNTVDATLDRVGLNGANNKYPSEISGGMQKRVGIARAIILKPKYLFCDEPNSGLDPTTSLLIDELIRDLTIENKMTTVINTHDMNSVMEIGDKINLLYFGELEWTGNCKEVMTSNNEVLRDFIFASPFLQRLRDAALENGKKI